MEELSLRETQLAELEILIEFDKFCKENNLKYSLDSGTLLGAIRHKGFIPWDDDIDVSMPRADYEKLYALITEKGGKIAENLELVPDRGENARLPFMKIVDKNIFVKSAIGEAVENLWIDIFPFDGFPADDKKAEKLWKRLAKYKRICLYNYANCSQHKGIKKLVRKLFAVYAKAYGLHRAIRNIDKIAKKYPFGDCERVGMVVWSMIGIRGKVPNDSFEKLVEVEFEGKKFPSIYSWHEYLCGLYGDYMQLPPENQRHTHSFTAYKK